jgi:hypothetical protein
MAGNIQQHPRPAKGSCAGLQLSRLPDGQLCAEYCREGEGGCEQDLRIWIV